jgi:NitT/TauT family transport system ATP-binding protein
MLRVENVSFAFGNRQILDDVSLDCEPGETIGVVGKSGIGKSTLLNLIGGVLPLSSGRIQINGLDPIEATQSQAISYLFQSATLLPWLTVAQNVALPLRLRKRPSRRNAAGSEDAPHHRARAERDAVVEALNYAHIADAEYKFPHELSGGMQTRVALARAIVHRPQLLLADEPFNALDDVLKETLYNDLQAVIALSNIATLIVTHNLSEAILLSERVYVLGERSPGGPSGIMECVRVPFPKPRSADLLNDPDFGALRKTLRRILK